MGATRRSAAQRSSTRLLARRLDADRLHLNDGPIDLIVRAWGGPAEIARAEAAATTRAETILDELVAERSLLSRCGGPCPVGAIARTMHAAAALHAARGLFITPMAAVAGAVADAVLAAMTQAADLDRAFVNNGGDIAFHLAPGHTITLGMLDRPDRRALDGLAVVRAADGARGAATSGWRGRSFSLGIADAVTVLAIDAARADAAATVIANACDLPGHPAISRVPATAIDPASDLGARLVTRAVGPLASGEINRALGSATVTAAALLADRSIVAAAIRLAGRASTVGGMDANAIVR